MSRESRVKKAKLAEQAERYEDMVQEMNEVVTAGTFISFFAAVSGCEVPPCCLTLRTRCCLHRVHLFPILRSRSHPRPRAPPGCPRPPLCGVDRLTRCS